MVEKSSDDVLVLGLNFVAVIALGGALTWPRRRRGHALTADRSEASLARSSD
jgi:hypothetical protein